jgi:uncharacterized protein (TIGR02246 family)
MIPLRPRTALLTFALLVPLAACGRDDDANRQLALDEPQPTTQASPAGTAQLPEDLQRRTEEYLRAWNGNDPAAVAPFFTEDAVAIVNDSTYAGRAEIQRGWLAPSVPVVSNLQLTQVDTQDERGDEVVVRGRHTYTARPPQEQEQQGAGSHEVVWTRVGGNWQIRSTTVRDDT